MKWLLFFLALPCAAFGLQPILRHYIEPSVVRMCDDFVLHCEIGSSYDDVWWTQNGSIAVNSSNFIVSNSTGNPNVTVARMHFICAQHEDAGNYTCHVKSGANNAVANNTISVTISRPLTVLLDPWILGTLDRRVVLNCTIHGFPLPSSIQWMKNDKHVESSEVINVSQRVISTSEITSTLEIFNLTEAYLGPYSCSANSTVDEVASGTTVVDKGLNSPQNITVSFESPHSLHVEWRFESAKVPVDRFQIKIHVWENGDQTKQLRSIDVFDLPSLLSGARMHMQTISSLEPNTPYIFTITACNHYIGCSNASWSANVTLPGYSSPPTDVQLTCHYDNISTSSYIDATWVQPSQTQSEILHYQINVSGYTRYPNGYGSVISEPDTFQAKTNRTFVKAPVRANTNYSLKICTVTSVGCNEYAVSNCSTSPTLPKVMPEFELKKVEATDDCRKLKLNMKRISQRNGPIKCYRIVLYKMRSARQKMPDPENIHLLTYDEVHKEGGYGAYVAEAFNGEKYLSEVILGDDVSSRCGDDRRDVPPRARRSVVSEVVETDAGGTVRDGELAAETHYTGFVEVKVVGKDDMILTKRSSLFMPVRTGLMSSSVQAVALAVICGLVIVIIILAVALCALSKRNSLNDYEGNYHFCDLCGPLRWSRATGMAGMPVLPPPDLKPIKPENLPGAFQERHKDSDLLFQREFESLPEAFRDRTTNASDMVENFMKNRYPDIRAYDQTRVKLSTLEGVPGSDYINANYVMGYKEKKKFICAQGPLEKTVDDFWRMIWQEKVSVVAMMTCLEENGKKKCTKYWPDKDETQFGNFTVTLESCKTCSDYVVRKLAVCLKKEEGLSETRAVVQYHYLTWKDFLAPEHPGGILKFIKRINEAYSSDKGPILIHCSAGVGRTGTLVVIDSLLQQMKDEGLVEIFNFIVSVRRQRNFLVQSLKQYIFIYRALMEFAQFGDTEMKVSSLSTQYSQLCTQIKAGKSALKAEFEKLNLIVEDAKTCDIATMDVNASKNRFPTVVPYDRNRVILTPVPSREHSMYINASHIQGYDQACSFIVTQDPMEETVNEFWRMVHEQNSSTIVMLSVDSAPQYWPDASADHDHVAVKLESAETLEHFVKREFSVKNTKSLKSQSVRHYHFREWTAEVPSNVAALVELVKALNFQPASGEDGENLVVVHCSEAGHRCGVFIACCILALQVEHEQQIDVFQLARNMRSHRPGLFQNFESYRFCYQFALDYSTTTSSDSPPNDENAGK